MLNYTVAEFRKNIREALNAVERGEEVYITRHNKTFAIIKAPFNYLSDDGKSHDIRPDIPFKNGLGTDMSDLTASRIDTRGEEYSQNIEVDTSGHIRPRQGFPKNSFPQAENIDLNAAMEQGGWEQAGSPRPDDSGEFPCCKLPKPCKHWQWDGVEQAYINNLSGRKKEV